tara:strand:- start:1609 stop:1875 length:267 start_codon:yes stop_codon:yes gene_type:complete
MNIYYITHDHDGPASFGFVSTPDVVSDKEAHDILASKHFDVADPDSSYEFAGVHSKGAESCQAEDDIQHYIDLIKEEESWLSHWGSDD